MRKIKNLSVWQRLLIGAAIMAIAAGVTFWVLACYVAPFIVQVKLEVDPTNVTTAAVQNFAGVEPSVVKAFENQQKQVRAGVSANNKKLQHMVLDLMGQEAVYCQDCGYTFPSVNIPKVDLLDLKLAQSGFACAKADLSVTKECGHVFPAGTVVDLATGLTCPDCGYVHAKAGAITAGFDGLASTTMTIGAEGFTCRNVVAVPDQTRTCTYVFPAGAQRNDAGSLICPECGDEHTSAEIAAALVAVAVPACPDCGTQFPEDTDLLNEQICMACATVCDQCGYAFPEGTDRTATLYCPDCYWNTARDVLCETTAPAAVEETAALPEDLCCPHCAALVQTEAAPAEAVKASNHQDVLKKKYQALLDSVTTAPGGELDVSFVAGEGGVVCNQIVACGHVFTAEDTVDLSKGLKCPDCKTVYIAAGAVSSDLLAALENGVSVKEGGFVCTSLEGSKTKCGHAFPVGTVISPKALPACEACGHQYVLSELAGIVQAAKVTITAEKPILIAYSMEYNSEEAFEETAAQLTYIVNEISAQIEKMAATNYKNIEHAQNTVHEAEKVANTGVRTILGTVVAAILAGMVAYLILTRDSFNLACRKLLAYTVLVVLSILCIVFFYIMFINSSRAHGDIQSRFSLLPGGAFGKNWNTLMANAELPVWRGMFNSLVVAGSTALLSTYFSVLTAYAIHAYQFRLRNFAFKFILLVMMVPGQVSALGFIEMVTGWNWDNTFWPLILPAIAAPTVFFFMKQYMDSALPLAIVEAARIDGSSEFGTFNRIVIHIMKPAIAVQAIFSFVGSWNNYFTPALLLNKKDMKTLPILIAQLRSADWLKFDMGQVYMMICLSILPVIVVYLCLSKFIIAGVAVGGVKE